MKKQVISIISLFILVAVTFPINAQKKLTFKEVYLDNGKNIIKKLPSIEEWKDDENYYMIDQNRIYLVNAESGKTTLIIDPEKYKDILKDNFDLLHSEDHTADYSRFVFIKDGDIYLFTLKDKQLKKITETKGDEQNPHFSPDGKKIAYTLDGDLYVFDVGKREKVRITQDGTEEILNGYASWIYYEEILGRAGNYRAFWWSTDSKKIAFMRFDQSQVPIFTLVRYEGDYGKVERQRYPKPGYPNPQVRLGIAFIDEGRISWIQHPVKGDQYLAFPRWNSFSNRVYYQWMNREQNQLKIYVADLNGKILSEAYSEKQDHWVEFLEESDLFILKNGDPVIRTSVDGWYHIYHVTMSGKINQITKGDWSTNSIELIDEKNGAIYFTAGREDSRDRDYYKVKLQGGKIDKITEGTGTHYVTVSPGGSYFIDRFSDINRPPALVLRDSSGKLVRKIADTASDEYKDYNLAKAEMFYIPTTDGLNLPALWLLPADIDKSKKYPVVISIYGGPASTSVRNSWGYNALSWRFLAQEGIIVFSVDHRGSAHFGKKGIDRMHRCLGKWEINDYIEAVKYLRQIPFVDGNKIGITGGSYGGYLTALALTYGSDYFQFGIASASVINWRWYDSVYTERYMDTPEENPEGYKNGSVLTYIDKYKGGLRIDHGTIDDNVHMQNTIEFIDKMMDTGKDFELMIFPGQRHGYRGKKRNYDQRISVNFWLKNFFGRTLDE